MRLSILIPNYNYDCRALLRELCRQVGGSGDTEIVVADDCSTLPAVADRVGEEAERLGCRYLKAGRNMGRAAIRNTLADNARGQYLLFIDSDAMPDKPSLVADYMALAGQADVVCGTVMSPERCPSASVSLRWVYDHTSMPRFVARRRQRRPYGCFSSFCFMIRRDVFMRVRFDERFAGYGYEDTLFGKALEREGASIIHRDIGCFHLGLEDNRTFLQKVENSNITLLRHSSQIDKAALLLRLARTAGRFGLIGVADWAYRRYGDGMARRLTEAERPSYRLLQFYKLVHLCHLIHKEKS